MLAYKYNETTKRYEGEIERQIDPLESQKQGQPVYLMPSCATEIPPLEPKDGFNIVWGGENWVYEEEPKDEPEPEPEPTELELAYQAYYDAQNALATTDYRALKYIDGEYTDEEYETYKQERAVLRQAVRNAQERIDELEGK